MSRLLVGGGKSKTAGLTLRVDIPLLKYYEQVAARVNRMLMAKNERGNVTVQKVMLHRLRSLPAFQSSLKKK